MSAYTFRFDWSFVNWLVLLVLGVGGIFGLYFIHNDTAVITSAGWNHVIILGVIGLWRWCWLFTHCVRSAVYRAWRFPRWRKQAGQVPLETLPPLAIIIPTYREEPWITERVFRAIAQEAKSLNHPVTLIPVTTTEEIVAIRKILRFEDPWGKAIRYLPVLDPSQGKRGALAVGLEVLARQNFPEDGVIALMDGDSEPEPGTFRRSLPFFNLFPAIGALTTNETPEVYGSHWFSEWLNLRFCQRHQYMASYSFSNRVLCLTGRFSLFRAKAALNPSFRENLAYDYLNDWLWGQFRFFSGDDKTSWYWLLREGYDMIYLPDVIVNTIEVIDKKKSWGRAYQNMRRWSGNMLRNGTRALALGPWKTGWFTWIGVMDQRLSMWTSLVSPGLFILGILTGNTWFSLSIICWFLASRVFYLTLLFWRQTHLFPLRFFHLPILLIAQWLTSFVKIGTLMNLAQQKWTNRHGNKGKAVAVTSWSGRLKYQSSRLLLAAQVFGFVLFLCWQYGSVSVPQDTWAWWWSGRLLANTPPMTVVWAQDRGVLPNDGQDDSQAINRLLQSLPPEGGVRVMLPAGELDVDQPLVLQRSLTEVRGEGDRRTIFVLHGGGDRPLWYLGRAGHDHREMRLEGWGLAVADPKKAPAVAIAIEGVQNVVLQNLDLAVPGMVAYQATDRSQIHSSGILTDMTGGE